MNKIQSIKVKVPEPMNATECIFLQGLALLPFLFFLIIENRATALGFEAEN
jgi:hypothetical protein